jgi:hypothetical protein
MFFADSRYGTVRLRRRRGLHAKQDATTPFSVICAEVHLEREQPPRPLWLAAMNAPAVSLYRQWLWFDQRWPMEPAIAFRKSLP